MLGGVKIDDGIIKYDFSPMLSEVLYNPIIYQKINVLHQKVFKTSYGHSLWENCLRYVNVGSTGFASVEEWRRLLGAIAKTYDTYKDLKKFVLSPAMKEVNNFSNINVMLKIKKRGRKITELCFLVEYKKEKHPELTSSIDNIRDSNECKILIGYGIPNIKAITFIQEYGFNYINDKINYIKHLEDTNYHFRISLSGFLISAIENDWKNSKQIKFEREKEDIKNINKKITNEIMEKEKIELLSILKMVDLESLKSKVENIVENSNFSGSTTAMMFLNLLKYVETFEDFKPIFFLSNRPSYVFIMLKKEFMKTDN
jgi:hypothetical protein